MLIFTKVEGSGLIGGTGYSHTLAIPHEPTNELINSDSLGF
jgi:hypothetical protein